MSSAVTGQQPSNGLIGYLGLSDWWFNSLNEEDRSTIRQTYTPFGGCHLEDGEVQFSQFTPLSFLTGMAGWFVKDHLRLIAYRILDKAATYVTNAGEPLDIHFFYGTRIEVYYRDRDKPDGLAQAIRACADQIAYAPTAAKAFELKFPTSPLPWHTGYTQLAIILEKQKRYREAINVCLDARKNGWGGNWDARTARCSKKINLK